MAEAFIGIIISAMATGIWALPVLFLNEVSSKVKATLLGYASGIMMAATTFSLIPEALKSSDIFAIAIGMLLGTYVLNRINSRTEHLGKEDTKFLSGIDKRTLLIIVAITLHNLPEGLSVGVSYGASQEKLGAIIAFAIGLQNAPEGFCSDLLDSSGNFKAAGIFDRDFYRGRRDHDWSARLFSRIKNRRVSPLWLKLCSGCYVVRHL